MNRLLAPVLLALCLTMPLAATAQVGTRAYAPENLRTLSHADQRRVISLEYAEQSNGRRIPDDQLRFYIDQVNRSNWGFSRIKQDIAQSLAGSGPRPPVPPIAPQQVRCESTNNRPRTCPTRWNGPSRLVRQLSSNRCIEGQTWSSRSGSVYVTAGCRGEFAPGRGRPPVAGSYQVTCSSNDRRYATCAWGRSRGRPRLLQQLSSTTCIEGRTWGYDPARGLWVNGGCRGRFGNR
jgi:hypothetical protein